MPTEDPTPATHGPNADWLADAGDAAAAAEFIPLWTETRAVRALQARYRARLWLLVAGLAWLSVFAAAWLTLLDVLPRHDGGPVAGFAIFALIALLLAPHTR